MRTDARMGASVKRKGTAKRKIGARIVLAGFVLLCFCVYRQALALKNGPGNFLKETDVQEVVRNDGQMKQADIAAQCEVWEIRPIETGVKPEIIFQETESALMVRIKEYIEENACFLAWMQQNDKPIWGDEGKEAHYAVRGAIALDANGAEQIWAIDFWEASQKETVTFRISKMEESSLLLEVFDGGRDGRMLLSCKLIIIQEVGVSEITPVYWETIDCNGVTVRESENLAWNEMWERVLQEQRQRSIASWQGEKDFPDVVFNLMREEAWTGLAGEPNMLLESYRVDLTEDTERFMQMVLEMGEENIFGYPGRKAQECKWAYRWYGEDRGENFLTCINYNYAKDSIQWWKVTEGRLEEYDYVTECINPSQIINCEGRVYCITEAVPYYRGGEVYASILEIGNEESWREAVFSISTDRDSVEKQDFTCFALYEEEGLSLGIKDYVQKRYEEMARTCVSGSWNRLLSGTEEGQGLTAEARRILNSLSDGNGNLYANHHYFAADVDNDGMVEYGAADDGSCLDVTFYELEKGTFHSIPLQKMLPEQNDATGLLAKASILRQLWCEKLEDTTYLFTVEEVEYSPDLLLRIRVLKGNYIEDKAVYLLKVSMAEGYREWDLEITPSAEAVG